MRLTGMLACITLSLLAAPAAAGEPPDPALPGAGGGAASNGPTCENHGVITMVGVNNSYHCDAEGGCENHGVVALVGPDNSYTCGGPCVNHGIVLSVLSSYCDREDDACLGVGEKWWCQDVPCLGAAPGAADALDEGDPAPSLPPDRPPSAGTVVVDPECATGAMRTDA